MKQYLITAYDYTTAGALGHRLSVRPQHLALARKLKESGNFVLGGAMLDEHEKMIGSTLVLQFETEAELQQWKDQEPYILQKVWEKVEVRPFKVAQL